MSFNLMDNIDYKVGIYIRLSKEDEDKEKYSESESVQNQRELLMQYIKENKLNFVKEYVDDGVSGTSFDRPAFNMMISDIEKGLINMVITKDLSRLGRDYIKSGFYTETYFPEHNIRYVAILDNIDTSLDSANNDIGPFKSILNEMYAKDTSRKISSVLQSKREQGEFLGSAPYGYKKDPDKKNHLIVDEEAAKIVRLIFQKYLEGYGTTQIANYLSDKKVLIPSDYNKKNRGNKSISYGLWSQATVRFILSNEVYTGTVVQGKKKKLSFKSPKFINIAEEDWQRVYNQHEPIISTEDFERAKKILDNTQGSRVVEHDYLFKGLLKCYDCKGYIGIRSPDKYGNIYGRCQRYAQHGKYGVCSSHNFNYQVFENSMINLLKELCKEYSNRTKLEEIAKRSKSKEDKKIELENRIKSFESKIEKESRKLELLYDDRLSEIISVDDYIEKGNKIKSIVNDYKKQIENLKKELSGESIIQESQQKLNDLVNEFLNMEKPTKEIIREFIEKVEIHQNKQVDIYFNFKPLQELNNNLEKFCVAKKKYEKTA